MPSIAELTIRIDSTGAEEASKKLDNLSKSSEKVEKSLSNTAKPVSELNKELSSLSKQSSNILDDASIKSFDKSAKSAKSSVSDMTKEVDRLTASSNFFRETEEQAVERIRKVISASAERKQAALDMIETMRASTRASQEDIVGWSERAAAQSQAMKASKDYISSAQDLGKSQQELSRETAKSQKEFDTLLKKIDPTQAALKKLDAQVEQLGKHFDSGKLSQKQYVDGLSKLDAEYAKLESGSAKFSVGTKQNRQNVLQLLNALKNGHWSTASHNIAELGISANTSAASLLKVAAPVGVLGVTIGSIGYAYAQSYKQSQEFNKAILLTGNYANTSVKKLNEMTDSLRGWGGSQSTMATALAEATRTGKFTEEQLKKVAVAAFNMKESFNVPISETIGKFEALGGSPTQAILKLNEQYHFLTTSVYDQIKALEQQGDKTGATNLAIQEFSKSQQESAQKAIANAGYLERAWHSVTGAINNATAAVMNFGRTDTGIDKELVNKRVEVGSLELQLQKLNNSIHNTDDAGSRQKKRKQADSLQEKIAKAKEELKGLEEKNKWVEEGGLQKDQMALNVNSTLDARTDALRTAKEREKAEIDAIAKNFQELYKLNPKDKRLEGVIFDKSGKPVSGGLFDLQTGRTKDKYQTKITREEKRGTTKTFKDTEAESMLRTLKQQEAVIRGQLTTTDKLGSAQQQLIKFEQQIADLKEKKTLTASQKSLLADESKIKAQLSVNAALEDEVKLRKESQAQQQWSSALMEEIASKQKQADLQVASTWMGSTQYSNLKEQLEIRERYAKQRKALENGQGRENALSQKTYEDRLDKLKAAEQAELEIVKRMQAAKTEAEANWLHGANASYQRYLEQAKDVSSQTANLFANAFSGMEDSLVSFVRTGKLSFSSFADAILDDMARIGVRMATSSAMQALFGGALNVFGNSAGASSGLDGMISNSGLFAKGGSFSGGVQAFAKGGSFTNSVVNAPTPFKFAKGGVPSLGVMGEAGAEAIMPLTRTSSGDLGVRAIIDRIQDGQQVANTTANNIQVYVTIDSTGATQTTTNTSSNNGQEIARSFESLMQQWVIKEKKQGGLFDPHNRRN